MDLPEEAKRAPSAPVWNQSFPSPINKFCSVLFGVTVDWHKPSRILLLLTCYHHTNLLTTLHESCKDSLMHCVSLLSTYSTVEINHDFCPEAPRRNTAVRFGTEKAEWCGYPTMKEFENMFTHFDTNVTGGWIWYDWVGRAYANMTQQENKQSLDVSVVIIH